MSDSFRTQPLTDDEMWERARRNFDRHDDAALSELDLGGDGSAGFDEALCELDRVTAAPRTALADELSGVELDALEKLNRELESADEKSASREALRKTIREAIPRYQVKDPDYYRKKRKSDREAYAAKVGRPVRPYVSRKGMTPEQIEARKGDQAAVRMQRMRDRKQSEKAS